VGINLLIKHRLCATVLVPGM